MNWTRETPTNIINPEGGYYWCRWPGATIPWIFRLVPADGTIYFGIHPDEMDPISESRDDCEWAGPIPKPGEPDRLADAPDDRKENRQALDQLHPAERFQLMRKGP